eukprot:967039_1
MKNITQYGLFLSNFCLQTHFVLYYVFSLYHQTKRERERENEQLKNEQMEQLVNNDVIFGREWRSICSYLISNGGRLFNESLKEELEMTSYWSYYSTQAVVDPCFCVCSVFCSNDVVYHGCHGDKWSCLKEDDIVSIVC